MAVDHASLLNDVENGKENPQNFEMNGNGRKISDSSKLQKLFDSKNKTEFIKELKNTIFNQQTKIFVEFLEKFPSKFSKLKFNDSNILHILVDILNNSNYYEKTSEFIKIALNHGLDINEPDERNQTPFFYLLKFQPKFPNNELINYILDNYEVDFYNFRADDMQKIFKKQNPEREIPKRLATPNTAFILRKMIQGPKDKNFFNDFKKIFMEHKASKGLDEFEDDFSVILMKSSIKGLDDVTDLLVDEGIDVDRVPSFYENKKTPIAYAASNGHYKVMKSLLRGKPKLEGSKVMHDVLNASNQNHKDSKVNYEECFNLLLDFCEINEPGDLDRTPLHFAVQHRNNFAILELLEKGADITKKNKFGETPLDEMGQEIFEEFLDSRINLETPIKIQNPKEMINIDVKFLSNHQSEVEALELISQNRELRSLISHPVLSAFIFLKWQRYKKIFYSNFYIFLILLLALIGYILMCHEKVEDGPLRKTFFILSVSAFFLLLIRETFQLIVAFKIEKESKMFGFLKNYLNLVNVLELCLIIATGLVLFCEHKLSEDNKNILRANAILFSCFEIIHLASDLPFFSISTKMYIFIKVGKNCLKAMILYVNFIIAYALVFYVIYSHENKPKVEEVPNSTTDENLTKDDEKLDNFNSIVYSFLKVIVMGIGELDASNLAISSWFQVLNFLIFICIVPIVLLNVLCALAVDDLQKIKAQGELTDLLARINVLSRYEKIISWNFFSCWANLKKSFNLFDDEKNQVEDSKKFIKNGKIYMFPRRNYKISAIDDSIKFKNINDVPAGCFGDCSNYQCKKLCNELNFTIGTKIRTIIEIRKEKLIKSEIKNDLKNQIKILEEKIDEIQKNMKPYVT